jgi:hypothetical protein
LQHVNAPFAVAWTGKTLGIEAVHVHRLEQRGASTVVTSEESWDGPLVHLLPRRLTRMLQGALDSGLVHLKAEAERRSAANPP